MKVILLDNVKKIGKKYEKVEVSNGYANNLLIPKKLAIPATPQAEKDLVQKMQAVAETQAEKQKAVLDAFNTFAENPTVIKVKANEEGGVYAKLGADALASAFTEKSGVDIDTDYVGLSESLESLGEHDVSISAFDTNVTVKVVLEKEEE